MTSLSNVFKAVNDDIQPKKIHIRSLRAQGEREDAIYSRTQVAEREHRLQEVQLASQQEKREIEQMRVAMMAEIDQLRLAWDTERQQLERQAYEEGFQSGYQEGHAKVLADMSDAVQQANDLTQQSKKMAEDYRAQQERVILEIALSASEQILNMTLEADEERYVAIVKKAVGEVREMKEIRLYVAREDYGLLAKHKAELDVIFPPTTPFLMFIDESLKETECYIETNHGRLVVTVDEQLAQLKQGLIELIEGDETD